MGDPRKSSPYRNIPYLLPFLMGGSEAPNELRNLQGKIGKFCINNGSVRHLYLDNSGKIVFYKRTHNAEPFMLDETIPPMDLTKWCKFEASPVKGTDTSCVTMTGIGSTVTLSDNMPHSKAESLCQYFTRVCKHPFFEHKRSAVFVSWDVYQFQKLKPRDISLTVVLSMERSQCAAKHTKLITEQVPL